MAKKFTPKLNFKFDDEIEDNVECDFTIGKPKTKVKVVTINSNERKKRKKSDTGLF